MNAILKAWQEAKTKENPEVEKFLSGETEVLTNVRENSKGEKCIKVGGKYIK